MRWTRARTRRGDQQGSGTVRPGSDGAMIPGACATRAASREPVCGAPHRSGPRATPLGAVSSVRRGSLAGSMMLAAADPGLHPPVSGSDTGHWWVITEMGRRCCWGQHRRRYEVDRHAPWTPGWPGSDGASGIRGARVPPAARGGRLARRAHRIARRAPTASRAPPPETSSGDASEATAGRLAGWFVRRWSA